MIRTLTKVGEEELNGLAEEMKIRKTDEVFLLFTLGSQFDHLIAQAIGRLGLFCLVADPSRITSEDVKKIAPKGIILSGGPVSVYENPPPFDSAIFDLGIPVLGICLGFQLWAQHIGCEVVRAEKREFGVHKPSFAGIPGLLSGCMADAKALESHGDRIVANGTPEFVVLCSTENAPIAAAQFKHLYGVQFHPEVTETNFGDQLFYNFCFDICGAKSPYPAEDVAEQKIAEIRRTVGDKKVLLALSGGTDSSTLAYLLKAALGERCREQVCAVYIKGIDRPDDEEHVRRFFSGWFDIRFVDATDRFLARSAGKTEMYEKRVAMRGVYTEVLEEEIKRFGASFIAQGTLYTDISESGGGYDSGAKKAQIKLHHNVGLDFSVPELLPLSDCVKDTGRDIGRAIGVPEELLMRHPFPGPGLIIRIEGDITPEKLAIARKADGIWIEELRKAGFYEKVWQAGAVVTQSVVTCTKGDDGVKGIVVRLWAVYSVNGFTAQRARFPDDFFDRVEQRITNEIRDVGSVDYRLSGKPPATIECG
jgi:GMP synthase (glutamine-hydrolysing)